MALLGCYYVLRYLAPIFAVVATYRWFSEHASCFFTCLNTALMAACFGAIEVSWQLLPTTMLRLVYPFGRYWLTVSACPAVTALPVLSAKRTMDVLDALVDRRGQVLCLNSL